MSRITSSLERERIGWMHTIDDADDLLLYRKFHLSVMTWTMSCMGLDVWGQPAKGLTDIEGRPWVTDAKPFPDIRKGTVA